MERIYTVNLWICERHNGQGCPFSTHSTRVPARAGRDGSSELIVERIAMKLA